MAAVKDIEPIREQVKIWIKEYQLGAFEHGNSKLTNDLENLIVSIELSISPKSIEMIKHFYKLRNEIQVHYIDKKNFNKRYKKLNEKVTYTIEKMISKVWHMDYMLDEQLNRLYCFKSDVMHYVNELNNGVTS